MFGAARPPFPDIGALETETMLSASLNIPSEASLPNIAVTVSLPYPFKVD